MTPTQMPTTVALDIEQPPGLSRLPVQLEFDNVSIDVAIKGGKKRILSGVVRRCGLILRPLLLPCHNPVTTLPLHGIILPHPFAGRSP